MYNTAGLVDHLTSAASVEEQELVLIQTLCPATEDPKGCEEVSATYLLLQLLLLILPLMLYLLYSTPHTTSPATFNNPPTTFPYLLSPLTTPHIPFSILLLISLLPLIILP